MKKKSQKWLKKSIGFGSNNESKRIFSSYFPDPLSCIEGDDTGYHVVAKTEITVGEIIEEIPALVLHSSTLDMESPDFDEMIKEYSIPMTFPEKVFQKEGYPLLIGLGNFLLYGKSKNPNAEYIFDRTFNTFTVRAIKPIKHGEKISFIANVIENDDEQKIASDPAPTPKKEGGCGCGKKKNTKPAVDEVPVNTPEGKKPSILDYGVSETQGWNELPKELKAMVASKTSNCGKKKKQTPKFRSMVDGTPLTNND